jgi:D-alanyl-D-alanine carboxypeptidase-like protein
VLRLLAIPLALVALQSYESTVKPLPPPLRANLEARFWQPGCPVPLSQLRLLTVSHWGFDGKVHTGQLVVNRDVARPLANVFRRLYDLRFPIRHMRLAHAYGPRRAYPADGDVSGSFVCREAVPSPCTGGSRSGSWSNHAYGHAIDLNPVENPYVGCGRVHDPSSAPYVDRSRRRKGMVTAAVVRAFRSIGWGWGGEWSGATKDYMHFSTTGH